MNSLCYLTLVFLTGPLCQAKVKIMFIGDSITAGKGYCWRYHLWNKLLANGYRDVGFVGDSNNQPYLGDFDLDHEGYRGKCADEVAALAARGIAKYAPDIAIIHLGTNDWASKKEQGNQTAGDIAQIIDQLRAANPKVTILLAKIPFVSDDQRNAVANLTKLKADPRSSLISVDLTADWKIEPDRDTSDYVNPNLRGVLKITDILYSSLTPLLSAGAPVPQEVDPEAVNLAAGASAIADSAAVGHKARAALDGNSSTWWASEDQKLPHWIQIDLNTPRELTGTAIVWDSAGAPYGYTVETSSDGSHWTKASDRSEAKELSVALQGQKDIFQARGRYVRVTVKKVPNEPWTHYPATIREIHVYGK